jgi:hypothetical protein
MLTISDKFSTREQFTDSFTPGSGLDTDSLFGPILGTRISPGGNHLVYRIHCPPSPLVTILLFNNSSYRILK